MHVSKGFLDDRLVQKTLFQINEKAEHELVPKGTKFVVDYRFLDDIGGQILQFTEHHPDVVRMLDSTASHDLSIEYAEHSTELRLIQGKGLLSTLRYLRGEEHDLSFLEY